MVLWWPNCVFTHLGCGFVKYSSKETAMAAISGLNGTYTMRVSCESHKFLKFSHCHPWICFVYWSLSFPRVAISHWLFGLLIQRGLNLASQGTALETIFWLILTLLSVVYTFILCYVWVTFMGSLLGHGWRVGNLAPSPVITGIWCIAFYLSISSFCFQGHGISRWTWFRASFSSFRTKVTGVKRRSWLCSLCNYIFWLNLVSSSLLGLHLNLVTVVGM